MSKFYVQDPLLRALLPTLNATEPGMTRALIDFRRMLDEGLKVDVDAAQIIIGQLAKDHAYRDKSYREAKERGKLARNIPVSEQHIRATVYFIRSDQWVKIGWTSNLTQRLRDMSQTPEAVVHTEPGGRHRESQLHEHFAHLRRGRTEWFEWCEEIRDYIADART